MEKTIAEIVKTAFSDHHVLKYFTGDTIYQEDVLTVARQLIEKILAPYTTGPKVVIPDDKVDCIKKDMQIAISRAIRIALVGYAF